LTVADNSQDFAA